MITYFGFVCACVLINFVVQYDRIKGSFALWAWGWTLAAHYSKAAYPVAGSSSLFRSPEGFDYDHL